MTLTYSSVENLSPTCPVEPSPYFSLECRLNSHNLLTPEILMLIVLIVTLTHSFSPTLLSAQSFTDHLTANSFHRELVRTPLEFKYQLVDLLVTHLYQRLKLELSKQVEEKSFPGVGL